MKAKISVLLVDDHALVRRGFRRILEDESDINVVGECGDGAEAVTQVQSLKPRVVVMDCALPGMSGLVATRKILESCPGTAVLMLSMHPEETLVRQALDAGARGYVLKNAVDLELGAAIRKVVAGEVVLDPQLASKAVLKGERDYALTTRELEILQLIVDGKTNKEIASQLNLSANTVAVHRAIERSEECGRSSKNTYVQGDIESYSPDQKYDVILFRESIYYLALGTTQAALDRYRRYLADDNGVFIVNMSRLGSKHFGEIARLLEANYLCVEKSTPDHDTYVLVFR